MNTITHTIVTPEIEEKLSSIKLNFLQRKIIDKFVSVMCHYIDINKKKLKALTITGILIWEHREDRQIRDFVKLSPSNRIMNLTMIMNIIEELLVANDITFEKERFEAGKKLVMSIYIEKFAKR